MAAKNPAKTREKTPAETSAKNASSKTTARPSKTQLDDLVLANKILFELNVVDAFGHISVRHPGNPQRYFLSRSRAPGLVQPDDVLEYDLDSNPIEIGRAHV